MALRSIDRRLRALEQWHALQLPEPVPPAPDGPRLTADDCAMARSLIESGVLRLCEGAIGLTPRWGDPDWALLFDFGCDVSRAYEAHLQARGATAPWRATYPHPRVGDPAGATAAVLAWLGDRLEGSYETA